MMGPFRSRREFLRRSATVGGVAIAAATLPWARVALGEGEPTPADLFATINRLRDPANPTLLERKHVPVVEGPERVRAGEVFPLRVAVGRVLHPMKEVHWISAIQLLTGDGTPLARVELSPFVAEPVALFHLKVDGPLTVRVLERCNLHGLWEAVHHVTVA